LITQGAFHKPFTGLKVTFDNGFSHTFLYLVTQGDGLEVYLV
jgi:hypothetical protein